MDRKRMVRWGVGAALGGAGLVLVAGGVLWGLTEWRYRRTFDEVPYPDIVQRTDPETLAHGEYLAWNVVGCGKCHLPHDQALAWRPGERPPLQGGWTLTAKGFGTLHFPNITPDESGIAAYTAPEIGRMLRYGVRRDGRFGMTMAGVIGDMTDEDLEAIVSYIMSCEPTENVLPPDEIGPMFKVMLAWMIDPYVWPGAAIEGPAPDQGATIARGEYLAMGPANCVLCHSPRDPISFEAIGPPLSGGVPEPDMQNPPMEWSAPNLTPDPATGRITAWSEAQFIARIRSGRAFLTSNMPWESFAGMDDVDLQAIYRYLRSLDPVVNDTGPSYREAGWTPP